MNDHSTTRKPSSKKPERDLDVLAMDLPADLAADLEAITKEHPFTRTRLALFAMQIAMPELKRRYPVGAALRQGFGSNGSR